MIRGFPHLYPFQINQKCEIIRPMGEMNAFVEYAGELSAKVTRKDGTVEDLGVISAAAPMLQWSRPKLKWYEGPKLYIVTIAILALLVCLLAILYSITAAPAFLFYVSVCGPFAIVTTTGVTYMAADFAGGGASPHIGAFNFHDNGTGTNAAATSDTALQTPTGGSRVSGTQSQPGTTNIYRTVATISFTSAFAITEWGLFSASTSGTLWDRRVFSAINVANGDSIQYTYNLTVNAGGT